MIPRIIHYCWLSDDPIPEEIQTYINGWRELMPDYVIKKWDKSQIDFNKHPFVRAAFNDKKYAFAADYIRVYALFTEGGVYLDSDVKVLQSFDKFLSFDYFTSYENHWSANQYKLLFGRYIDKYGNRLEGIEKILNVGLQAAVIASIPHHPFVSALWDYYRNLAWNGWEKVTAPTIHSRICEQFGLKYLDKLQLLKNNMVIFPSDVFCTDGCNQETSNTHAVHVCAGSWIDNEHRLLKRLFKGNRFVMSAYLKYKIITRRQK